MNNFECMQRIKQFNNYLKQKLNKIIIKKMYLKNFESSTTDKCNYSIEISPNNESIFLSLDEKGYILPKNDFL